MGRIAGRLRRRSPSWFWGRYRWMIRGSIRIGSTGEVGSADGISDHRGRLAALGPKFFQLEHLHETVMAADRNDLGAALLMLVQLEGHREGVEFCAAVGAGADVAFHLGDDFFFHVHIEVIGERVEDLLARQHQWAPMTRRFGLALSLKYPARRFLTFKRSRWRRDFTAAAERLRKSVCALVE